MSSSPRNRRLLLLAGLLVLAGGGVAAYFLWFRSAPLPGPDSPVYQEYLRAFQVGVAALDTPRDDVARKHLTRAVELIPGEPAGWANLALLKLRKNEKEKAARDLQRAQRLAPDSGAIEALLGHLAEKQGRQAEAVAHFRKAVEKDPHDLPTLYALAEAVHKEGGPDSKTEYQRVLEQILKVQPNNLKVLRLRAAAAFQNKDMTAVRETLDRLARLSPGSADTIAELRKALTEAPEEVEVLLVELNNSLQRAASYPRDARAVEPESGFVGEPLQTFLRLQPPRPTPAPPDRELTFKVAPWTGAKPVPAVAKARWDVMRILWRISEQHRKALLAAANFGGAQVRPAGTIERLVFVANAHEVRRADAEAPPLPFPGGRPKAVAPSAAGVLPLDWNNDFLTDLLLAGAGGLVFHQQQADGSFKDVTEKTGLPPEVREGDYYGAWAADVEMDGDLDVIAARRSGPVVLLRNNRDGTFKALDTFAAVKNARAFVWADLDNDGAPDAAFLDAQGKLHVFANDRSGQFRPWPLPANLGTFLALAAADVNDDGVLDLVALRTDGTLVRISDEGRRKSWQVADLARWPGPTDVEPGSVSLFIEDLDNNGALDLVVAGPKQTYVYLADEQFRFASLPQPVRLRVGAVTDVNGDGQLDLVGLSAKGQPVRALNRGEKNYNWQTIWPLASLQGKGDNRINSFGIGGEVEVRSGVLVQKQPITAPVVHFGLGEQPKVAVARIVWPNGVAQTEFEMPDDRVVAAEQRLSGSCPFLFTYDGAGMRFVGDFMWGTPLGMYVNGQNIGDFPQTTEWLKIPGEHLVPRDGYYDVRVQANLWEADYFDQLALIVVDHPTGTEIYADERFFLTPTKPKLYVTTPARPVARAWDHHGSDATAEVRAIDGCYLDRAGRGRFQGVTRDHWVEADLGDDAPTEGPVYLIARGWLHPTNSSINVALAQGKHEAPKPLVLEVPDGKGGWKVGRPALGFPAGRNKTMLIRLDGIEGKGVSRRFRLRTNMEIYWDFLGYARGLDAKLACLQRPKSLLAELRYRGILETTQKDASCPEIPHYEKVVRGGQPWRDLTGYYTRFGDVRELLAKVDDRYVIMNAGDEIALRFPVPEGPPSGWKRDFLWECDGWTRDGDLNTRHGNTVLPLPAHGRKTDDRPPGRLEDDPVYRRFPEDWRRFHTRYVTSDEFARGLRNFGMRGREPSAKR
jgi:Tfp pilus assembly protein PilF